MAWRCIWQPECEVCKWRGAPGTESEAAEEHARLAGWVCGKAGPFAAHLCPECARLPRPGKLYGERVAWEDAR